MLSSNGPTALRQRRHANVLMASSEFVGGICKDYCSSFNQSLQSASYLEVISEALHKASALKNVADIIKQAAIMHGLFMVQSPLFLSRMR